MELILHAVFKFVLYEQGFIGRANLFFNLKILSQESS
jgi:hypothetical protein